MNIKNVLLVTVVILLMLTCAAYYYLYEAKYSVLFDELGGENVNQIVEHLKKENVDYKLDHSGKQLLVEAGRVEDMRSDLILDQLSTSNVVGFELFDNTDIGMTEFAQKLNHQRALQGELSKTISAFPEIKYARIHLVLPEDKLFGRNSESAKAAVSLFLNQGMTLSEEQVKGIKKLVASSVPKLNVKNVIVNDQNGFILAGDIVTGITKDVSRLQRKQKVENYFINKLKPVLEHLYGKGNVLLAIDVTLVLDDVTMVKESLIPNKDSKFGMVARRKESTSNSRNMVAQQGEKKRVADKVAEVEYLYGKKIENIAVKSGSIDKISVGVLLPGIDDDAMKDSILDMISMAVGLDTNRGDTVKIHFYGADLPNLVAQEGEKQIGDNMAEDVDIETSKNAMTLPVDLPIEKNHWNQQSGDMNDVSSIDVEDNEATVVDKAFDIKRFFNTGNKPYYVAALIFLFVVMFIYRIKMRNKRIVDNDVAPLSSYDRQENYELIHRWLMASK